MWRLRWFLFSNIHYAIVIDEIERIITCKTRESVRLRCGFVVKLQQEHYRTSQGAQSGVDYVAILSWERTQGLQPGSSLPSAGSLVHKRVS